MEQYISLIVFLIVTFLLLFIQQYIIQKGKNLATKKDIKSITKDIEIIKSQLEISTSNKKWFLEEQNKIMVQLVEKVFEINNELLKLPDWDETSKISITDKYYTKTRKKINEKSLGFYNLRLFIEDQVLLNNIGSYYKQLVKTIKKKKEIIEQINEATQRANESFDKNPQNNIYEEYIPAGGLMQPDEYSKLVEEYMDFYSKNIHGEEFINFISSIRKYLKSAERN